MSNNHFGNCQLGASKTVLGATQCMYSIRCEVAK